MIFCTCVLIHILLFLLKKRFHEKVKVYSSDKLDDCCGYENVVASSLLVIENGLVSSKHSNIVRSKL